MRHLEDAACLGLMEVDNVCINNLTLPKSAAPIMKTDETMR